MRVLLTELHERMQERPVRWFYMPVAALVVTGVADLVAILPLKASHEVFLLIGPLAAATSLLLLVKARRNPPPR